MKLSDKDKKLLVKALAFIIPFITILIGFIIGGFAPFGNKDIMTAAGYEDMLPYLTEFHDLVSSGNPFVYSNRIGTGYDFSAVITYYLSDPTNMIILFFPKASMLAVIDILYVIKVSLAGLFAYFMFSYLSNTSAVKKDSVDNENNSADNKLSSNMSFLNLGLSVAYALSSAMVGYGMNITWLSAMAILPLVIMGLEKIIRERKPIMYLVTFAITILCSFNMAIIVFIFTILYLIKSDYKSTRHILLTLLNKLAAEIIAAGLTMFMILNNLNSSFFKNNTGILFPKAAFLTGFFDYIKALMTGGPISNLSAYGKGFDVYAGIFIIFFVILYVINNKIKTWTKLKSLTILFVMILGTILTSTQFALNGFNSSILTKSVFSFTLVIFNLLLVHDVLTEIEALKMKHFITAGITSVVLIIATMILCKGYDSSSPFITSMEVIIVLTIASIIWQNKNINLTKYSIVLLVIIIAELAFTNVKSVSSLGKNSIPYNRTVTCAVSTCADEIHMQEPDAKILAYDPYHTDATPISESVLGYDYVLITSDDAEPDSNLEYVTDMYGIHLYKNPDAIKNGIFVKSDILNWDTANEFYYSALNIFSRDILGSGNIFTQTECKTTIDNTTYSDSSLISYNSRDTGDFYTNLSKVIHVGNVQAGKPSTIRYVATFEDSNAVAASCEYVLYDESAYHQMLSDINQSATEMSSYNYTFDMDASEDGYLMVPADMTNCSKVMINNEKASSDSIISKNIFSSNVSLIKVNAGNNKITMNYNPGWLIKGLILSVVFLLLFVASLILVKAEKYTSIEVNENKNKFERFLYDNRVYIYTIVVSTLLYVIVASYNQAVPFGTGSILVSDGYAENYPTFMHSMRAFKDWYFSTIDYSLGFMRGGHDLTSFLTFINPLRIIPLFFPEGYELLAFNTLYAVEFILIGPSILIYLTHRPRGGRMNKNELKLIPIALCYNLSSYVLCYYSFAGFLEMTLIFPIIMLALDRLIYEKKYIAYIVLLSLFMIDSVYMAFLMCEFLALYFFTMDHGSIKDLIKNGIRFAIASITSALIASFTLLPFYGAVNNTNYSSHDKSTASNEIKIFTQNIIGNLKDTEVLHRLSMVNDEWNVANTYCGLLILLIIPLYLMNVRIKLSERIKRIVLIAILYFSYGNELMNFVFHGFHKQTLVPNRFAIFVIFVLVTLIYDLALNYKDVFSKKKLIVYSAFSAIIAAITLYNHQGDNKHRYYISIAFIACYLISYIYFYVKKKHYNYIKSILTILVVELMITSLFTATYLWSLDTTNENNMVKLKKLSNKYSLSEDGLMHTEILNNTYVNSSCLIGTNSISEFSSTLPLEKTTLVDYWASTSGMNIVNYGAGNPMSNIMLNVPYFFNNIYSDETEEPGYFKNVDELSNIILYKDPYVVGSGIFFDDNLDIDIDKENFDNQFEFQNYISNKLVGQNLYEVVEFTKDESLLDEEHSYILMQETDEDLATPLRICTSADISGIIYLQYDDVINYLGEAEEGTPDEYDIVVHEHYENLTHIEDFVSIGVLNIDTLQKLSDYINTTRIQDLNADDAIITGTSDKENSGTLYIPLPNYSNWHVFIDDKEVEKLDYMNGIGIHIPEGKHNIKVVYEKEANTVPYLISLIFILLFITFCIIDNKKHSKKPVTKVIKESPEEKQIPEEFHIDEIKK